MPSELLLLIGENLSIKDIYHLLSTCGLLSSVLTPVLEKLGVQDVGDQSALQWAAERGHASLARLAILRGAQIDEPNESRDTQTPRRTVARRSHPDDIYEIELSMTIDAISIQSWNPLHLAAQHNHPDVVRILVSHGARIDARDGNSRTPLHMATKYNNHDVIATLAELGATIDARDKYYRTPLHWATKYNYRRVTRILVSQGATIDAIDQNSRTPLHLAAKYGNLDIIRYLVAHGATIDSRDEDSLTPLHLAAEDANADNVRFFVIHGAAIDAGDRYSRTPLYLAAGSGDPDTIRYFISHGATIHPLNAQGNAPAHRAASEWRVACMEAFIEAGFPLDTRGCCGQTVFHNAAIGNIDVLMYLLRQTGAEKVINLQDRYGSTPLHMSAATRNVVQLLLHGADPELKDNKGRKPALSGYDMRKFEEARRALRTEGSEASI